MHISKWLMTFAVTMVLGLALAPAGNETKVSSSAMVAKNSSQTVHIGNPQQTEKSSIGVRVFLLILVIFIVAQAILGARSIHFFFTQRRE